MACRTRSGQTQLTDNYLTGEIILEALYNNMQNRGPPFATVDKARELDRWVHSIELSISLYRLHAYHVARWLPWPLVWAVTGAWSGFLAVCLASQLVRGKFVVDPPEPEPNSSKQGWVPGLTENGLLGLFPASSLHQTSRLRTRHPHLWVTMSSSSREQPDRMCLDRMASIGD